MTKRTSHRGVWVLLAALAWAWPHGQVLAAGSLDATITVTPVADVSLILTGATTYAFGSIPVNSSTNSATALTLTNNGNVSVVVDKRIEIESNPNGWTAGTSPGLDAYVLYCATSTTRLQISDFVTSPVSLFGTQGTVSNLAGPSGTQPVMPPSGVGSSLDLWFRLDMPTSLTNTQSRTITVRFTGMAQ